MFGADSTFGELIDEVLDILSGAGSKSPTLGTLASDITDSDLTVPLVVGDEFRTGNSTPLAKGLIEIDLELLWVDYSDGATATIPAWGRGFKNTTAAAHTAGSKVTVQPRPPRATVGAQINRVIRNLYPRLFAVGTEVVEVTTYPWVAELPEDCVKVLQVETRNNDADQWVVMSHWEQTVDGVVLGGPFIGVNVRFTYAKLPVPFTALTDEWAATGLAETTKNVVVDGVLADMITWIDVARLDVETAESHSTEGKQVGNAAQIARQNYMARYEVGVQRERQRLDSLLPHKQHWIR